MKRFFSYILLCVTIIGLIPSQTYSQDEDYFVVTAYYSPLPDQSYYITGNYESEIRLNGRGTNGASGREVFSGMLAAPKKYGFGTKIYLEGLGIGDVQDRGGAIVPAGERGYSYDRIDVWVGVGEEGLRRAMYWGKRKVKGHVVSSSTTSTLNYNTIPAPLWAANNLKKVKPTPVIPSIFSQGIGINSSKQDITELQEFLKEVGKYKGEIDGIYNNEIIDIIFDFQVEHNLISYEYEYGSGYWGTQTRKIFQQKYLAGEFGELIQDNTQEKNQFNDIFDGPANSPEKIETLQKILAEVGLYEGEIDGDYSSISPAIFEFQVVHQLIDSNSHPAAGWFGPKTRETLKGEYESYLKEQVRLAELEEKKSEIMEQVSIEAEQRVEKIGIVRFGEVSPQVREFQLLLNKLGYFNHKDTAIFGKVTSNSILKFQIDNDLVLSASDLGAGNYGPKTKEVVIEVLTDILYKQKLSELELVDEDTDQEISMNYFTA